MAALTTAELAAKKYLNQARILRQGIDCKVAEIAEIHALSEHVTSAFEAVRVSGTPNYRKLEDATLRREALDALEDALVQKITEFTNKYLEISAVIDAVSDERYRELLTCRYLECMTWEETAVAMNYSYVHVVHNLHPQALSMVKELIVFNTKNLI